MNDQWAETGMGMIVLAVAAIFLIYAFSVGGVATGRGGYEVSARFDQVGSLAAGDAVKLAGVKIGTVSKITLDPKTFLAKTNLDLDPTVKLPADSTAKITSDSLLGGVHVTIEPGGSASDLKAGGEIENTQGAVDLFGLIGQVMRPQSAGPATASGEAAGSPATQAP